MEKCPWHGGQNRKPLFFTVEKRMVSAVCVQNFAKCKEAASVPILEYAIE
jgi:hypothetical protein